MRILALYDIHGNPDALEAVLGDPRAAHPDAVVIGGDVVPGAFSATALDRLPRLGGAGRWVRGEGGSGGGGARGRRRWAVRHPARATTAPRCRRSPRPSWGPTAPARWATYR